MPADPTPSPDQSPPTVWQLEEQAGDFLQQMLDQLRQQTSVGGKRVAVGEAG